MPGKRNPPLGASCKQCGNNSTVLSANHLCPDCSLYNVYDAVDQLRIRRGPVYDKWLRNLVLAMARESEKQVTDDGSVLE